MDNILKSLERWYRNPSEVRKLLEREKMPVEVDVFLFQQIVLNPYAIGIK